VKILILVLSCLRHPYDKLMLAQQRTWDSVDVPGVETIYYYGGGSGYKTINHYSREYGAQAHDGIRMAHWKYALTLSEVMSLEWDFIFRTNSSSYVNKRELLKIAKELPPTRCYCGQDGCHETWLTPTHNCGVNGECRTFVSGCGHFISRDVANILINDIQYDIGYTPDDVHIGDVLIKKHGLQVTPGWSRIDYYGGMHDRDAVTYHYRCKKEDNRQGDIDAFNWLFNRLER
jgi:hypothetical protein